MSYIETLVGIKNGGDGVADRYRVDEKRLTELSNQANDQMVGYNEMQKNDRMMFMIRESASIKN